VKLEIAGKPKTLTRCNCSICRRYGARWAYYTRHSVRVVCRPEAVTAYLWNDREIEFYHCNTCGCLTHYESIEKEIGSRIAVNARMMSPQDIEGISLRTFDGASSWQYIDVSD